MIKIYRLRGIIPKTATYSEREPVCNHSKKVLFEGIFIKPHELKRIIGQVYREGEAMMAFGGGDPSDPQPLTVRELNKKILARVKEVK